jgi:hypothetical protein
MQIRSDTLRREGLLSGPELVQGLQHFGAIDRQFSTAIPMAPESAARGPCFQGSSDFVPPTRGFLIPVRGNRAEAERLSQRSKYHEAFPTRWQTGRRRPGTRQEQTIVSSGARFDVHENTGRWRSTISRKAPKAMNSNETLGTGVTIRSPSEWIPQTYPLWAIARPLHRFDSSRN